jgi:hypothetical protein
MGIFINLAIGLLFSWISFLLTPKPKPPKAASLEDFGIPKADEGDEIGKVFGTVVIRSPSVAWYGGLRTKAIKQKAGKK